MRLWSLHPKYLDKIGLLGLWREGLLAKKVLQGKTRGYRKHPQLNRFRDYKQPIKAINSYLEEVYLEALNRGYNFDKRKIRINSLKNAISVTDEQIDYEKDILMNKLKSRDTIKYKEIMKNQNIDVHPLFFVVKGKIQSWEKL